MSSITFPAFLQLNTIWVSCEGENPADVENVGAIKYIPNNGFPGYFFPYENSEGYLSPLIAVHFVRPKSKSERSYFFPFSVLGFFLYHYHYKS